MKKRTAKRNSFQRARRELAAAELKKIHAGILAAEHALFDAIVDREAAAAPAATRRLAATRRWY
jgi:hypothetical protein